MQKTYVHPWYLAVSKLVNTITSESESMLSQQSEQTGATPTNALRNERRAAKARQEEDNTRSK